MYIKKGRKGNRKQKGQQFLNSTIQNDVTFIYYYLEKNVAEHIIIHIKSVNKTFYYTVCIFLILSNHYTGHPTTD